MPFENQQLLIIRFKKLIKLFDDKGFVNWKMIQILNMAKDSFKTTHKKSICLENLHTMKLKIFRFPDKRIRSILETQFFFHFLSHQL